MYLHLNKNAIAHLVGEGLIEQQGNSDVYVPTEKGMETDCKHYHYKEMQDIIPLMNDKPKSDPHWYKQFYKGQR